MNSDSMTRTSGFICQMIPLAEKVLEKALEILKSQGEDDTGAYLTVFSDTPLPLNVTIPLLVIPAEKIEKYSTLSSEKAGRLFRNPKHRTSYESRDMSADIRVPGDKWGRWGGAIRAGNIILSLSGLPELWDEAVVWVVAIRMNLLNESEVLGWVSDDNPHLRPLLTATENL